MRKIANYDTYDYDYSTYWNKREYEHISEEIVLNKLLKDTNGKWFIDIGGSFGRLSETYCDRYSNPVIVDYSLKTLQKNYKDLKDRYPNIELISANAYNLPFKDSTFDGGLMVRVLHHIEKPKEYFKEVFRTLVPDGIYIQEYANKVHIKALIRALFKFNLSIFSISPYQQPDKHNYEGAKEGNKVLFLNYHPKYISDLLSRIGFKIEGKYGCSFLRSAFLKKALRTETLVFFEKVLQNTLSWANISPSIFLKSRVQKNIEKLDLKENILDILVCPECKGNLSFNGVIAKCNSCKLEFEKKENIWDFRV